MPTSRPCARGCCATQAEHYRSLHVSRSDAPTSRTRTDEHGTHSVDVTEHRDGRQDVLVRVPPVPLNLETYPPIGA